uniref:Uncharacterized protein n=1 Tax=Heterorhabditis bacteriophora TaxID=37862 RepID=A0A1I7WCH7_HETBA
MRKYIYIYYIYIYNYLNPLQWIIWRNSFFFINISHILDFMLIMDFDMFFLCEYVIII